MDPASGPARPSLARRLIKPTAVVVMAALLLAGLRRVLGTFDYDQVVAGCAPCPCRRSPPPSACS